MKNLIIAAILLCSLATAGSAESLEFKDTPAREIVGVLLNKMGKKMDRYEGIDKKVDFSFEGSPENAFKAFLEETGMRAREYGSLGVTVKYIPPLPPDIQDALDHGKEFKLYSISPGMGGEVDPKLIKSRAYGYDCLGEVLLNSEERQLAKKAILASVDEGFDFARCFLPHHILAIDDSTVMVICFQCHYMEVSTRTGGHKVLLGDDYGLTSILQSHDIPLVPSY